MSNAIATSTPSVAQEEDHVGDVVDPHDRSLARELLTAQRLARLSTEEIGAALRAANAPRIIRSAIERLARRPSARLGSLLARFDAQIGRVGLASAAREVLGVLGAKVNVDGSCPSEGAVLVVTNHPGAYDALAIMSALGRDDVAFIAADRAFLRAMPGFAKHLVFVAEDCRDDGRARKRAGALRSALRWLDRGHVLVQFGAGTIEPDARFVERSGASASLWDDETSTSTLLGDWSEGTGWLARRASRREISIVPAFISGVHSPRAKRLFFVRWAERRGITTIAPLVQATVPGFRDVVVSVTLGAAMARDAFRSAKSDRERALRIRAAALRLA